MAEQPDFILDYVPFLLVTYGTAIVAWSCVGRFLLELVLPPNSPNYIYRWFRLLTQWAVRAVAVITPRFFHTRHLLLITAFWTFVARFALTTILLAYGMVPVISRAGAMP